MKPKHKVITRSPHRTVGLVPCRWLQNEPIEYESQLEYRGIKKLIVTPHVTQIKSQPFQVLYGENGCLSYTPDLLVTLDDGRTLVIEVKPLKFVEKQRKVFDAVDQILRPNGFTFCVVTEHEIDIDNSDEEISILLRYAKGAVSRSAFDSVNSLYIGKENESFTIDEICRLAKIPKTDVLHLLGRRMLFFENDISTSENTKIKLKITEDIHDDIRISNWLDDTAWGTNPRICKDDQLHRSPIRRRDHTPRLHLDINEDTE